MKNRKDAARVRAPKGYRIVTRPVYPPPVGDRMFTPGEGWRPCYKPCQVWGIKGSAGPTIAEWERATVSARPVARPVAAKKRRKK